MSHRLFSTIAWALLFIPINMGILYFFQIHRNVAAFTVAVVLGLVFAYCTTTGKVQDEEFLSFNKHIKKYSSLMRH